MAVLKELVHAILLLAKQPQITHTGISAVTAYPITIKDESMLICLRSRHKMKPQ